MQETKQVTSVCPYCGVGCGMVLETDGEHIIRIVGDKSHPANRGRLCTKGQTAFQVLQHPGRLASAYSRTSRDAEFAPLSIHQAIQTTADTLNRLLKTHGPEAISFYVSGQMSMESQYLVNKLAKGFIGTSLIESNSRLCMASAGTGYKLSLGSDAPPGSYDDFDHADLFLVIGANMADCHPILFLRMMERVKAGAQLIVVDPRRTATADKATIYASIKPGTDIAFLNGLLFLLREQHALDHDFIHTYTDGWEALDHLLDDYSPSNVERITGISEADMRRIARLIAAAPEFMTCWTMGLNQSSHGTFNTNAICNLHLATGKICRKGSGPFSLTGQPNAMGGREMGYMGPGLPGQRTLLNEADRQFVAQAWGVDEAVLPRIYGNGTVDLFERMAEGQVKACWVICTNPAASVPNGALVKRALETAEFVVAQDTFFDTETNRLADVLLPGALWAEAEGVMINSERNITLMAQAVNPPGDAMADWEIIALVAKAMGYPGFDYTSAAEVFDEIKRFSNPATGYDLRGVSHAALRKGPLQWPCSNEADMRNPLRYLNDGKHQPLHAASYSVRLRFATPSGKAHFLARPHSPAKELPCNHFPFVLNTGRLQHQWHTLTKTGKIATLQKLNPSPFIEIHPDDANRLGISDGDQVEVKSRRGRAYLPALLSDRVSKGECFAPIHWNGNFGNELSINAVTSDIVDPLSQQPELKIAAVALTWHSPAALTTDEFVDDDVSDKPRLYVVWGSQTGNAEQIAHRVAAACGAQGWQVVCRCWNEVKPAALTEVRVIIITSTFGDGDAPDNAALGWQALSCTNVLLTTLQYAVFAMGDSSYAEFCGFGKKVNAFLHHQGAHPLVPLVCADTDFESTAEAWFTALSEVLAEHLLAMNITPSATTGLQPAMDESRPVFSKTQPLTTRLIVNRRLNSESSNKDIRQFGFDLTGSGMTYNAGDALGVWPENCRDYVTQFARAMGWNLQQPAPVNSASTTLEQWLMTSVEITKPTKEQLVFIAEQGGHDPLHRLIASGPSLLEWMYGRQTLDVLLEYPITVTPEAWAPMAKPLQPRLYSIASSSKAQPDRVDLTVSAVRYPSALTGEIRKGVASTYLADRITEHVKIFVQPSKHFHVPDNDDAPLIMVGPGTGIAPFRGFLQERAARKASGKNWLLFGEQHASTDFYYRDELDAFLETGVLTKLSVAFSRDQPEKIYVQQRMREDGATLWQWLEEGAYFCICGDAARMAKDVDVALREVIQRHGHRDRSQADDYVRQMVLDKRYLKDVY